MYLTSAFLDQIIYKINTKMQDFKLVSDLNCD